jgi:carbon-monoxide dehydrogenase small subunit
VIARPLEEVWEFFGQIERVVPCLPGASLTAPPDGDCIRGRMAVKLGPITTDFSGEAQIARDTARQRGTICGFGCDRLSGSRAHGDVAYQLHPADARRTRVEISIRALLSGALAQFGRSGIADDLAARLTDTFARNLERRLSDSSDAATTDAAPPPLAAGTLLWPVLAARLRAFFNRILGRAGE